MKIGHTLKKNMVVCLGAIGIVLSLTGCTINGKNTLQDTASDSIDWFEDTGILVRDYENRISYSSR